MSVLVPSPLLILVTVMSKVLALQSILLVLTVAEGGVAQLQSSVITEDVVSQPP